MKANSTNTLGVQGKSNDKVIIINHINIKIIRDWVQITNNLINLLPDIAYAFPIRLKIQPVIIEWWCQEKFIKNSRLIFSTKVNNVTFIWTIENEAIIFFISEWVSIANEANTNENKTNTKIIYKLFMVFEKNKKDDIVAYFNAYDASTTLPDQLASTWASGNQIDNGKVGVFPNINNELVNIIIQADLLFKKAEFNNTYNEADETAVIINIIKKA